ncbi:hypothetical protein HPB48_024986 [Haemaphysalis longicornis]|uniref:Uncharacterized protein n=1 Tax=Haemaphysalis longicornis TaxID=44386 RepID=A0A9J6H9R4_HAELO|nr:hypothetical protein HPB48_024986 [Haemaphysalis longicornis]
MAGEASFRLPRRCPSNGDARFSALLPQHSFAKRHCFRYFNGRVYLNSGAAPTVFDVPGYLLKGTRNALPSVVAEPLSDDEEQGSEIVEEKSVRLRRQPIEGWDCEAQLRRSLLPPTNSTPGQRMSAESKESDGKRPIIRAFHSATRLKRLPEKLRSGDYDRDEEPAKKVPRVSPKLDDSEPRISDDEYHGSESEDLDVPEDLDEEDEFEVSDAESPTMTSSPAAVSRPTTSFTVVRSAKALQQDGKADSPAARPASITTAGTVVELYTKLSQQCAKNEELTKQLAKAHEVITKQNQNVEALQDVIDGLRRRVVAMAAKLGSDEVATDVSGDRKG